MFFTTKLSRFNLLSLFEATYTFSFDFFISPFESSQPTSTYSVAVVQTPHFVTDEYTCDFILPGCSPFEKKATYFNFTGNLQETVRILATIGLSTSDWRTVAYVSNLFARFFSKSLFVLSKVRPLRFFAKLSPLFLSTEARPNFFLFTHLTFSLIFLFFRTPINFLLDDAFVSDKSSSLSRTLNLLSKQHSINNFI